VLAVVVEDEWAIRMQVADALSDAGWEVEEFASGERAIEYLNRGTDIKLLITDIRLTGALTGWDVAEAYRHVSSAIRVLYCSGNPPEKARLVENSEFMPKPCDMDALLRAVAI
jgi:DNA-binding response OmpR family regulator